RLNLKYGRQDAEALAELLKSPNCGGFRSDRITVLTDAKATTGAVTWALRTFLRKAAKDDIIVIFFACHGAADVGPRGNIFYLLTWDTDPDDIASTALPMREVQTALNDYVRAERGVILVDTCHGAPVAMSGRAGPLDEAGVMQAHAEQLGQA